MIYKQFKVRMEPFETADVIGASVSGGADSMALCDLARRWCEEFDVQFRVFTFDHNLRAESADEAMMVQRWCADFGIEHTTKVWSVRPSGNMLEAARDARLEALDAWRGECSVVLVGHTKTDRAETVVMNMVRGSGVDGLSGMQPSRVVGSPKGIYTIVRPVIDLSRHELRAYCEENNIPFCDDPSNDNEAYLRVKVRKLMAELDMNEDALVATARRMHRARGALEDAVDRFWTAHVTFEMGAMNEARFEVSVFVSEMEETQMRLIRRLVSFVGKEGHPPRELAVKGVVCSLAAGKAATLGGCLFKVKKGQVQVVRENRGG